MKPYLYSFLVLIISCTSSSVTQENQVSDSLVAMVDTSRIEETVIREETVDYEDESETVDETEVQVDTLWLSEFAGRPLGMNPYEYIKGVLEGKGVDFDDPTINENTDIVFGNSMISILITEAYGNVVCSLDIDTPLIPMMKDVTIGMAREDFLAMAGIPASLLTKKSDDTEYFEFNLYYEDNTSTRTTFWLDDQSLIRAVCILPLHYV